MGNASLCYSTVAADGAAANAFKMDGSLSRQNSPNRARQKKSSSHRRPEFVPHIKQASAMLEQAEQNFSSRIDRESLLQTALATCHTVTRINNELVGNAVECSMVGFADLDFETVEGGEVEYFLKHDRLRLALFNELKIKLSDEGEKNDAYLGNANGLRLLGQKDTAHASRPLVGTTISVDKFHST